LVHKIFIGRERFRINYIPVKLVERGGAE